MLLSWCLSWFCYLTDFCDHLTTRMTFVLILTIKWCFNDHATNIILSFHWILSWSCYSIKFCDDLDDCNNFVTHLRQNSQLIFVMTLSFNRHNFVTDIYHDFDNRLIIALIIIKGWSLNRFLSVSFVRLSKIAFVMPSSLKWLNFVMILLQNWCLSWLLINRVL